jgi:peptide/nickel transport system permease protein
MKRARRGLPLQRDRAAQIALVVLVLLTLACLVVPFLPGQDSRATVGPRLASPSSSHWFGTDELGRSLFPRVAEGLRTTFLISVAAVLSSTVVATVLAVLSSLYGGVIDRIVVRLADAFFAFPATLLAILVSTIMGGGQAAAIVSISIITFPLILRVVRSASLAVVDRDFITSSWIGGASATRIGITHVIPNVAGVVVVQATYAASVAMLTEGGLSFLGFGVRPPQASLGSLVQQGSVYVTIAPWMALIPGAVLAIAIMAVNLLGDGLRDALDPRAERGLS